ncbi:hypothetical protein CHU98_g1947 [Xylaria longipes]|nr:hypothetical protein CHU98_g1947 [Xylaria longipes]
MTDTPSTPPVLQFGWIGLGSMGNAMAKNLHAYLQSQSGTSLSFYNRTASRGDDLEQLGGERRASVADLAACSNVIFISASDDAAVESIIGQIISSGSKIAGKTIVDTTTIHPDTTKEISRKLQAHGAHFAATPAFGATPVAANSLLCLQGRKINFVTAGLMEIIAEAHVFAEKTGLGSSALEKLLALNFGTVAHSISTRMTTGVYIPGNGETPWSDLNLALKDVGHGVDSATQAGSQHRYIMDMRQYNQAMIASYSRRTASENSSYMLPLLKADMRILDVGCGPGTITLDLAAHVVEGSVTGIDASSNAIESANGLSKQRGVSNASFLVGDVLKLPFDDNSFDIVHAHQVLGHLPCGDGDPGPVWGLKEMRRVCKPGGLVCAREVEWSSVVVYPRTEEISECLALIERLAKDAGKVMAGGRGKEFARRAGFGPDGISASAAAVTYSNVLDRDWWGENMASRLESSPDLKKGVELGYVAQEVAARMPDAWREWARADDAFYCVIDGQVVCTK